MIQSKRLKGSAITCSSDYYTNWTWIERFDDNLSGYEKPLQEGQNLVDGLDLKNEFVKRI